MGRTIPSFRIVLAEEKKEWKPLRDALDKSESSLMICGTYLNSTFLLALILFNGNASPIIMSILFHHYKELKECISEVEQIERVSSKATDDSSSNKKIDWLTIMEEEKQEEQKQEMPLTTLNNYFFI